jgi:hypothetical protein
MTAKRVVFGICGVLLSAALLAGPCAAATVTETELAGPDSHRHAIDVGAPLGGTAPLTMLLGEALADDLPADPPDPSDRWFEAGSLAVGPTCDLRSPDVTSHGIGLTDGLRMETVWLASGLESSTPSPDSRGGPLGPDAPRVYHDLHLSPVVDVAGSHSHTGGIDLTLPDLEDLLAGTGSASSSYDMEDTFAASDDAKSTYKPLLIPAALVAIGLWIRRIRRRRRQLG